MVDFIVKLIDPKNDYTKVVTFVLIYLASLWILFCFWVFMDSQKRFKNFIISVIFFLLVLILNIPALIFYLIIRPEKDDENVFYLHHEGMEEGGVNVPIVNFVGKNGVEMTLQIKINKPAEDANLAASNMDINVDWKDESSDFQRVKKTLVTPEETTEVPERESISKKLGKRFGSLRAGIGSALKKKPSETTPESATKLVEEDKSSKDKVEKLEEAVEESTKES